MKTARGSFVVARKPEAEATAGEISFGRYTLNKTFVGDLQATSTVDMLSAGSLVTGAGVYVALESVEGSLHGKKGTFLLVHHGLRTKDAAELVVRVVPGCATGELQGLEGTMTIRFEGEAHLYELEYNERD